MEEMNNLEIWELEHGVVMPCLTHIGLMSCPKLKALTALGNLPSLVIAGRVCRRKFNNSPAFKHWISSNGDQLEQRCRKDAAERLMKKTGESYPTSLHLQQSQECQLIMATALVSFMLQKLDKVYLDYIHQEVITLVVGVEEDVKKLTTTFNVIQAVLYDAELRQIKDEAVKLWLQEFKDIAYDMDDILDEWSFQMHRSQTHNGVGNKKKVSSSYLCSPCSCFSKVALRHNIGTQIIKIKERLDQAEMEKNRYRLVEIKTDEKPIERLKSSSLIDVSDIVGRVTDKETIMRKLMFLGESSTGTSNNQQESSSIQALHSPNIISIVGMGGIGKTTLAQLIFNDDEVKTHFEKTMWVCVSNTFDLVTVTKAIIEEANCEVPKSSEWNALHHCLSDSIKGKRFLLVLDDVWTEDRSIWEPLEVSFRYGAKGSRILVTTRNERVAYMMNTTHTHYLGNLSNDDCCSLLSRIALAGRNKEKLENHEDFKELGESISKKCKGLPLAAKILGGLLHFKKSKKEWLSILESEIWKLEEVENGFLKPALLLSYYDLPLPLKGCFAYCSVFPKDYTIEKDFLIKLWMAQGFLKNTSRNEELEMIGEDYLNNLAMRSFFQDLSKDSNGNIICCKMHDLVYDFAQFLTKTECSVTLNNGTQFLNSSGRVRHLTLVCDREDVGRPKDSYDHFTSLVYKAKKLRTLQIFNGYKLAIKDATADLFYHFRCLKVLCLNDFGLESLSSEIENLIHLRYLDLSNNYKLKILPETISNLYNLQTLKLHDCRSLCELPREMWRIINLRHLDIGGCNRLSHIPQGIGGLTSLRTLSDFIVGVASEGCKISELKNLNLLQGDLSIMGLGRVETVNEAFEMELKQKNLHTLALGFEETENELEPNLENIQRMEEVLEVLEPHPDLVELRVTDYLGFKLSKWIERTSFLCHMRILKLYNCINLTKLPAVGQLPSLEVLDIKKANKVKHIGFEFSTNGIEHVNRVAFPKLKELNIFEMDNLEGWEVEHGFVMPCLRCISLVNCPKLKALPALGKLPFLEELFIREANELEWEVGVIAGKGAEFIMPCLREVEICGFKKLRPFLEVLSKMSSLKHISISGEATEFIKYVRHDSDDDGLHVVREALFPNLKKLQLCLMDIEELKIGINVMPSLTHLDISDCDKLSSLQGLSKLETLSLHECSSLHELPLPNLKDLTLMGAIHPSLPQAFASTVCALEYLTMVSCISLTCIPEQVQQLTSLQTLWIGYCGDELKQRCSKDKGEDWRIISHIPNITII